MVRVVLQGLYDHIGSEVRASDAYVHNICNGFAGIACKLPQYDLVAESFNLLKRFMHFGQHVYPIHFDGIIRIVPECRMKDRPVFCCIDLVAVEILFDAVCETTLFSQLNQQIHGFAGDPVLGIIQHETFKLQG